jgi:hypothetical protein
MLLIFLIIVGDIVSGAIGVSSPVGPIRQYQSGQTGQCTVFVSQAQCSVAVTFPVPFTKIPTVVLGGVLSSPGVSIIPPNNGFSIIADTIGLSWTNMPVAKTELMGNTNDEMEIPFATLTYSTANIMVNCVTASNSLTAGLWAQWADPLVLPYAFTNLTGVAAIDVNDCAATPPPFVITQSGFSPFMSAKPGIGGSVILRIMGSHGAGIGDTPVFSQIQVQFSSNVLQNVQPGVETLQAFPVSTTSMTVTFGLDSTYLGNVVLNCRWTAYT